MTSASNPWVGVNYIPDNPQMEVPPAYWLQRLFDFDSDLVLLPSRQRPFTYVLGRKRRLSGRWNQAHVLDQANDTGMCAKYNLVPVCQIFRQHGTSGWSIDNVLADLAARDTWRVRKETHTAQDGSKLTGAAAVVERQEEAAEKKLKADIRENLDHRSRDGWRSYQARTGQRIKLNEPR